MPKPVPKKKLPQWVEFDLPMSDDIFVPACPFCGKKSFKLDKDGVGSVKPCKHLEFMFVGACADFEHRSKRFEKAWGKAAEADEDFEHCFDRDALGAMGYDETLVVFEVTTSGMACGPVSDTVSYGFQMEVE